MRAVKAGMTGGFMVTFFFVAVLAILAFLAFTGPDGVTGPRNRQ